MVPGTVSDHHNEGWYGGGMTIGTKGAIGIVLAVGVIAIIALSLLASRRGQPTVVSPATPESGEAATESQDRPAEVTDSSLRPIRITGTGSKNSAPFTITTNEWLLQWTCTPEPGVAEYAGLTISVYPKGETTAIVRIVRPSLRGSSCEGSSRSYAGPGEYCLRVGVANLQCWEVCIQPVPEESSNLRSHSFYARRMPFWFGS